MAAPLASIGIPVHNGGAAFSCALASLRAQTIDNLEIVIADNASTDETKEVAEQAAYEDARVHHVRSERLLAPWENFQRAFGLCSGEWFHWACHDDWIEPDFMARCIARGEADDRIVTVISGTREVDSDGSTIRFVVESLPRSNDARATRRVRSVLWHLDAGASVGLGVHRREALARTSLITNVAQPDRLLALELARLGRIAVLPDVLQHRLQGAGHRQRDELAWLDPRNSGSRFAPIAQQARSHAAALEDGPWPPRARWLTRAEVWAAVLAWRLRTKVRYEARLRRRMR